MASTTNANIPKEQIEANIALETNAHLVNDHVASRGFTRSAIGQPFHFLNALNKYEVIQGTNIFLSNFTNTLLTFIPLAPALSTKSYIHQSLRLTRYRDFRDDVP